MIDASPSPPPSTQKKPAAAMSNQPALPGSVCDPRIQEAKDHVLPTAQESAEGSATEVPDILADGYSAPTSRASHWIYTTIK